MEFKMNHIHLKAPDVRRTSGWYVENLGAEIIGEAINDGVLTLRTDLGGVRVNITAIPHESESDGTTDPHVGLEHFGLETVDLDATLSQLEGRGIRILERPRTLQSGIRIAFVEAPDKVRLELMQMP